MFCHEVEKLRGFVSGVPAELKLEKIIDRHRHHHYVLCADISAYDSC